MSSPSPLRDESAVKGKTRGLSIRNARLKRRWSRRQLAQRMSLLAQEEGGYTPAVESLTLLINMWEHDRSTPGGHNQRLLAAALELGPRI